MKNVNINHGFHLNVELCVISTFPCGLLCKFYQNKTKNKSIETTQALVFHLWYGDRTDLISEILHARHALTHGYQIPSQRKSRNPLKPTFSFHMVKMATLLEVLFFKPSQTMLSMEMVQRTRALAWQRVLQPQWATEPNPPQFPQTQMSCWQAITALSLGGRNTTIP